MDPDTALKELREWVRWCFDHAEETNGTEERAAECFDALDSWISRGGFLPTAWIGGMRS